MADKRVDELADLDALADADSFPVRDASATTELKEVTAAQVATYIDAAGAAASAVAAHSADTTSVHGIADTSALETTSGAQAKADAAQAAAVQRSNHTGTQAASTISDFATAADARIAAASIDDLSDVTITTPSSGQVLKWNGSAWVNGTDATGGGGGALDDVTDVTITTPADNEVLAYNSGTSTWINQTAAEAGLAAASHNHDATYQPLDSDLTAIAAANNGSVLAATTASFTTADETKLDGIEAGADVTDTANVAAAGALIAGNNLSDLGNAATARTNLGVDAAGTDNSTDVTLAGTPDYITISGQTITRNPVDLAADVTGNLPLASGGTGGTTATAARSNLNPLNTVAATGATETLLIGTNDCTMDQNCTFTFPTVGAGRHEFTLILRGAFTPTFPASVDWPSGTPPTYASPTEFSFATVDSGTTWLGVAAPGFA